MISMTDPNSELSENIFWLQNSLGNEQDLQQQEQAAQYLLEHAEVAHPRLLALLETSQAANPFAIVELLPRFGRLESVSVLASILQAGQGTLSHAAGQALAHHPLPEAAEILRQSLTASTTEVVIAAADGLLTRADSAACSALVQVLDHPDATVRYHLIQAAANLGCLTQAQFTSIQSSDLAEEIREFARQQLQAKDWAENDPENFGRRTEP
jgi:hypothetical protein